MIHLLPASSRPVARIAWRRLDGAGQDACDVHAVTEGWVLTGRAEIDHAVLDYQVRCDAGWLTLGASVRGTDAGAPVSLDIARGPGGWTLNDRPVPGLSRATDIDLAFTPATNLMPVRRLKDGAMEVRAAWLRWPQRDLVPLDQTYTRRASGIVAYCAVQTGYETTLTVNPDGFVAHYPGLWTAEAAHVV